MLTGANKYDCSGCKRKVTALKSMSIEKAPRILMVDFVRYNLGRKIRDIIPYPKRFNLKAWMSSTSD
jgi:ubiquitin C-terminal hydrolase